MTRRSSQRRCTRSPSFTAEIKRQLAAHREGDCPLAELAGLVDAAGEWDPEGVTISTSSVPVARSAVRLWREEFSLTPRLSSALRGRFGRSRYAVRVEGNRAVQAEEELRAARHARTPACRRAYLRGAFQGAASVTRPGLGHHLEFVHRDREFIDRVVTMSRARLKVTFRRGRWVAYTKSADGVTTVLAQLGLYDAVLEYEARAVVGEAKAHANRVTNFDAANAGRTAKAAVKQLEALQTLDPDELPGALRDMLELRIMHPDASLSELARIGGMSKSAVNHRLRRLLDRAWGGARDEIQAK